MSTEVKFENLKKTFIDKKKKQSITAVESFNLVMKPGEFVSLLGPSGCGKTTVLRMLAGFETPSSGQIYLDSENITRKPPNERKTAMVFQNYALFPHLSVLDNIRYGLKFKNFNEQEKTQKLERIVSLAGLSGYESRRPNELSGGQQQRVALARAIIVEPRIMLFDEPLSNLDVKLREFMRNEIRRIQKELRITTLYVTHDQIEAMCLSDKVVVMSKGHIEQVGSPMEIFNSPQTKFVADFVGMTNFFPSKVSKLNGQDCVLKTRDFEAKVKLREAIQSDQEVLLSFRPEDVRLDPMGKISGKLIESSYLGEKTELIVQLPGGEKISARVRMQAWEPLPEINHQISLSLNESHLVYVPR